MSGPYALVSRQALPRLAPDEAVREPAATTHWVGGVNDPAERAADALAADVVRRLADPSTTTVGVQEAAVAPDSGRIRRRVDAGGVGLDGGALDPGTDAALQQAKGAGRRLDGDVRRSMEAGFGRDLGHVRIHDDATSHELNTRIQARAFTAGNDVFFKRDEYRPDTPSGQQLLAHELAHVVQGDGSRIGRKIDEKQVAEVGTYLGITKAIQAVEVPNNPTIMTTTPFSAYPDASKMNLSPELEAKSLILLQFPDWETNAAYDADFKEYFSSQAATSITDMLGGGAYNHTLDLVVLREPYTDPELLHEMGHKSQAESGINAGTASVLFLEYQNVIENQNRPWLDDKDDAEPPRLMYSSTGISTSKISSTYKINSPGQMTDEIWAEFVETATTAVHHDHPEAGTVLASIGKALTGKYATTSDDKGSFDKQVKFNLIAEYLATRG